MWRKYGQVSPKGYISKLFNLDADVQRETTEEARLVDLLLDGRLEELIRVALEEIQK